MSGRFLPKAESWALSISEHDSVCFSNPMVSMSCQCFYTASYRSTICSKSLQLKAPLFLSLFLYLSTPQRPWSGPSVHQGDIIALRSPSRVSRGLLCPGPVLEPSYFPWPWLELRCRYASNQACNLPMLPWLPGLTLDLPGYLRLCWWGHCSCLHCCHPQFLLTFPCRAARSCRSLIRVMKNA